LKDNTYLFLLGGYDLEMVEIKKFLDLVGEVYIDKKLSWGAKLSAYQADLGRTDVVYVGIELIEDIPLPANYISIDHHNERSHEPASIEQIATLLGISLSRYQRLVAANDKGHIPAMEAIGASLGEIQKVRRADRKAQGVTEEMERQAQKDLLKREHKNGIVLIKTVLTKFSPLTDRLKAKRLLIYNDTTLCYYGKNAEKLSIHYKSLVDEKKAYSGGGSNGFFGLVGGLFEKEAIEKFVREIIEREGGWDG